MAALMYGTTNLDKLVKLVRFTDHRYIQNIYIQYAKHFLEINCDFYKQYNTYNTLYIYFLTYIKK